MKRNRMSTCCGTSAVSVSDDRFFCLTSTASFDYDDTEDDYIDLMCVGGLSRAKRVAVVVDGRSEAKNALLWALSHALNPHHDILTLLSLQQSQHPPPMPVGLCFAICNGALRSTESRSYTCTGSFQALCKAYLPEARIEVVMIEEENKGAAILKQVRKLEISVLVFGQEKRSLLQRLFQSNRSDLMDFCIERAPCLTFGVRKQSNSLGGYIINTRQHKNFWQLA